MTISKGRWQRSGPAGCYTGHLSESQEAFLSLSFLICKMRIEMERNCIETKWDDTQERAWSRHVFSKHELHIDNIRKSVDCSWWETKMLPPLNLKPSLGTWSCLPWSVINSFLTMFFDELWTLRSTLHPQHFPIPEELPTAMNDLS